MLLSSDKWQGADREVHRPITTRGRSARPVEGKRGHAQEPPPPPLPPETPEEKS